MEPEPAGPSIAPLIVIVGETASGKSALGLALAQKVGGEIISADSWTVYKGFDIGTAKPSAAEQARVRHHLLGIADPQDGFSAPQFQKLAQQAIAEISVRGKIAILVGGTGLYVDSLIFDYQFLPPPMPGLRDKLNALTLQDLQKLAHDSGYDTSQIDLRNKRRVIRLLENEGQKPTKQGLRPNTLILGVKVDREDLLERVAARVDRMFKQGLEKEVEALAEMYGWQAEPMKGIGYREWYEYFEGSQTLEQTRDKIVRATMNLAKRQRTWFRRTIGIQWLASEDTLAKAVEITTTFLNK